MNTALRGLSALIALFAVLSGIVAAQTPLQPGSVIISHFSPEYAVANDEFVVLYNPGSEAVDLSGWELRYLTSAGNSGSANRVFTEATVLPACSHMLFASQETVHVGSANIARDGLWTAGMSSTGGQLVLRKTADPATVIAAVAWGTVTVFAAAMTDAAVWPGDGMLRLEWTPWGYDRTSFNTSNLEYGHTSSSAIDSIPSLAAGSLIAHPGWQISVLATAGMATDSSARLGIRQSSTDGFDPLWDEPLPPPPPGNHIIVAFPHPEYGLPTGSNLMSDYRRMRPHFAKAFEWKVRLTADASIDTVRLQCVAENLPAGTPVVIWDSASGIRARIDTSGWRVHIPIDQQRDITMFVGDTTQPTVAVISPTSGTDLVSGTVRTVQWNASDATGLDSAFVEFRPDTSGSPLFVGRVRAIDSELVWNIPRGIRNLAGSLAVTVTDVLGNVRTTHATSIHVIAGRQAASLVPGWNLVGVSLEPADVQLAQSTSLEPSVPAFPCTFVPGAGYRKADFISAGAGLWLGVMQSSTWTLEGYPNFLPVALPLRRGFCIIASPYSEPVARVDMKFAAGIDTLSFTSAAQRGWIAGTPIAFDANTQAYSPVDTLVPGRGAWLAVLGDSITWIGSMPIGDQSARVHSEGKNSSDWMMVIHANVGKESETVVIGTDDRATAGFDPEFDQPQPPTPPGGRSWKFSVDHPEWRNPLGNSFAADIRPTGYPNQWAITLSSNDTVRLTWEQAGPSKISKLELVCDEERTDVDLARSRSFSWKGGGSATLFVQGPTTGVSEESGEVATEIHVGQPYPNPFNSDTRLSVVLPDEHRVTVKIFDVLGRTVEVVYDGVMAGGRYEIPWPARVASGTYLMVAEIRPREGEGVTRRFVRSIVVLR